MVLNLGSQLVLELFADLEAGVEQQLVHQGVLLVSMGLVLVRHWGKVMG